MKLHFHIFSKNHCMINLLAQLGYLKLVGKIVKDSVVCNNHVGFIETFFQANNLAQVKNA